MVRVCNHVTVANNTRDRFFLLYCISGIKVRYKLFPFEGGVVTRPGKRAETVLFACGFPLAGINIGLVAPHSSQSSARVANNSDVIPRAVSSSLRQAILKQAPIDIVIVILFVDLYTVAESPPIRPTQTRALVTNAARAVRIFVRADLRLSASISSVLPRYRGIFGRSVFAEIRRKRE